MNNKIIALGLMVFLNIFCQPAGLKKIDQDLSRTFQKLMSTDDDTRYDTVAPLFKEKLLRNLSNPVTFHNPLESLSKYVVIVSSRDKKIKFYSWDDFTGGTWHHITAIAQFVSENGKVVLQQLNSGSETGTGEFTDSVIYEVHGIVIGGTIHYLTFGWGTHGSGNQHNIIQVFRIAGDKLEKCESCFDNPGDLVIEYPRIEKLDLAFDASTNEVSFNELIWDDEMGYYKRSGKTIILKLIQNTFSKKE